MVGSMSMIVIDQSVTRATKLLSIYRKENGGSGNNFSHARDLIVDLMHFITENNFGEASDLLETANQIFEMEKDKNNL